MLQYFTLNMSGTKTSANDHRLDKYQVAFKPVIYSVSSHASGPVKKQVTKMRIIV